MRFFSVVLFSMFIFGCGISRTSLDLAGAGYGTSIETFDGKKLGKWRPLKKAEFELPGPVSVKDGILSIGVGNNFSGVSWGGNFPKMHYEFELSARRVEGGDIFCGILFPVGTNYCSMVLGGWGNSIVGLSCVDYASAAENETAVVMSFENRKWYKVRLQVADERIRGWIDEKLVIDLQLFEHNISPYPGLDVFEPFGIFTWGTGAEVRDLVFTRLYK